MSQILDSSGRQVQLGREFARGFEGAIFDLRNNPGFVAKLYIRDQDAQKVEKLRVMQSVASDDLLKIAAWPTSNLFDESGKLIGFVQPRVVGHREIHQLYSPVQRKAHFPTADWAFLLHVAMNVAGAFATLHSHGHVVGDINQSGVFVSAERESFGTVRLIDCDSFQIRHNGRVFFCKVGVPHYTPPELVGRDFGSTERDEQHDCFGLALLIFHLLFMGRHPFSGRYSGSGDMSIERAISEGRFAFSKHASSYLMSPPPHSLSLGILPSNLEQMFERAFRGGHGARPSATDWRSSLKALKDAVRKCSNDKSHFYPPTASSCPWCKIEQLGGPAFFISGTVSDAFAPSFDLQAVWLRITRIDLSQFDSIRPTVGRKVFTPKPLPLGAHPDKFGTPQRLPPKPEVFYEPLPPIPPYRPFISNDEPPFTLEDMPTLPTLESVGELTVPTLVKTPLPSHPSLDTRDHVGDVNQAFQKVKNSRKFRRLRVWIAAATLLVVLATLLSGWLALVLLPVPLSALSRFLYLYLPTRKVKKKYLRKAFDRMARQKQRNDYLLAAHRQTCELIETANQAAFQKWHLDTKDAEEFRQRLPALNAEKFEQWQRQTDWIKTVREAARARNAEKLAKWRAELAANEATRLKEWEERVKAIHDERERAFTINQQRRTTWNEAMRRHESLAKQIAEHEGRIAAAKSMLDTEMKRRSENKSQFAKKLNDTQRSWSARFEAFNVEFRAARQTLVDAKSQFEDAKQLFDDEKQNLGRAIAMSQRDAYLKAILIEDAEIDGIKKGLKATLASYGIETAYDVPELSRVTITGFGPSRIALLYKWRTHVEQQFKFNPQQALTPADLRSLHMKYHGLRTGAERVLRGGSEALEIIRNRVESEWKLAMGTATWITEQIAQSDADLSAK